MPSVLVELRAMIQFTIKSIILLTGVVASLICMMQLRDDAPSWQMALPFITYVVLIAAWMLYAKFSGDRNAHDERSRRAREADESNPTS
jgi:hypothetical protein